MFIYKKAHYPEDYWPKNYRQFADWGQKSSEIDQTTNIWIYVFRNVYVEYISLYVHVT